MRVGFRCLNVHSTMHLSFRVLRVDSFTCVCVSVCLRWFACLRLYIISFMKTDAISLIQLCIPESGMVIVYRMNE